MQYFRSLKMVMHKSFPTLWINAQQLNISNFYSIKVLLELHDSDTWKTEHLKHQQLKRVIRHLKEQFLLVKSHPLKKCEIRHPLPDAGANYSWAEQVPWCSSGKECKAHQQSVGLGSLFLLPVPTTHWAAGTSGFFAGQRVYTMVFFQARDIACKC